MVFRKLLEKKYGNNYQHQQLLEAVYMGTSGFLKFFYDCTSSFLIPCNQKELSLKTQMALRKIGLIN
jgi:hypothetical protein